MRYEILSQKHPSIDEELWDTLGDLYKGGFHILKEADEYLPPQIGEPSARYRERLRLASYVNYFGSIVDYFVASLFAQPLMVASPADADLTSTVGNSPVDEKYYQAFSVNCDRKGTKFGDLIASVFRTALVKGVGYVGVDFPVMAEAPKNLFEEDSLGLSSAYAYEIDPEHVVDWDCDDFGNTRWLIVKNKIVKRGSPQESRAFFVEEFKVWTLQAGLAKWELYRTLPKKLSESVPPTEEIPLVASGITTFSRIPIMRLSLPRGLWVGNKIGSLAREHFQRRSNLNAAINRSLFAIPYVKLGPEISSAGESFPSSIQQNESRGNNGPEREFLNRGFMLLGSGDDIGFAEPGGGCYQLVDQQLTELVDEMFRTVHQMANSITQTTTALGRSGVSKSADKMATMSILTAYRAIVKEFAVRIYKTISESRGEHVEWTALGLESFESYDRDEVLKELSLIGLNVPSKTFHKLHGTKVALSLLGTISPTVQVAIQKEIEESIDKQGVTEQTPNEGLTNFASKERTELDTENGD